MTETDAIPRKGVTRREMLKRTLRTGAYTAPAIIAIATVSPVAAATPAPPLAQPIPFGQDAALSGAGALVAFDVYSTASNQAAGTFTLLGTFTTDRFGFGGGSFPLTLDSSVVSAVKLTFVLSGKAPTSPPAATFTSALVAALAPTGTGGQPPASFVGLVVQEPTVAACQVGPLTSFNETIDVALLNGPANTAYDFYVQPNTLGAPVKVATATTNARGNATVFAQTPTPITSAAAPSSAVVTAVLAGGAPTAAAFVLAASGATFTNISCTSLTALAAPRALGIRP